MLTRPEQGEPCSKQRIGTCSRHIRTVRQVAGCVLLLEEEKIPSQTEAMTGEGLLASARSELDDLGATVTTSLSIPFPTVAGTRRLALFAGPWAVAALASLFGALALAGGDEVALAKHPLAVLSSGLGLLSLVGLGAGLLRLRPTGWSGALAGAGVILAIGAQWSQLVVLPSLAVEEPRLAAGGLPAVQAGFILSFVLLAVGWAAVSRRLNRRRGLVLAGALLCIPPLPVRWFLLAIAVSLLVRDDGQGVPH